MNYSDFVGFYQKNKCTSSSILPEYRQIVKLDCGKLNIIYYNKKKEIVEFGCGKVSDCNKIVVKFKKCNKSKSEGIITSTENSMTVTNNGYGSKFGLEESEFISIHIYVSNNINKFYQNHYYFNNGQELIGDYHMINDF